MKKIFLLLSALVMTVTAAMAATTTFDFTGSDNVYGLTRFTSAATATYEPSLSVSDDGVDLTFSNDVGGCALMDAHTASYPNRTGLLIKNKGNSKIEIKVPGAKITRIYISMYTTGGANFNMKATYGGKTVDVNLDGDAPSGAAMHNWIWTDAENDTDVVDFTFDPYFATFDMANYYRYVHKVEVTYTKDLGGKEESDLSFSAASAEGIVGETFTAPTLNNPHSLPIVWSSSKETVATVDASGNVTLIGGGKTVIKATTEGNDSYVGGSAQYEITSIGLANNILELVANAPEVGQQVKVNFPVTVAFCSGANAYVFDAENHSTCINNPKNEEGSTGTEKTDIYKVGDVIPAGWIATNSNPYELVWRGIPEESTEKVEVVYPIVDSINYETDGSRVVVVENVVFTTSTPEGNEQGTININGTGYRFEDTFGVGSQPAGTYNVTLIVKHGRINWLAPINFEVPEITAPASSELKVSVTGEGTVEFNEGEESWYVNTVTPEDNATVTVEIPTGFDNFIYMDASGMIDNDPVLSLQADDEDAWEDTANLIPAGFVLGNQIEVAADAKPHNYGLYLVKGDKAYMMGGYNILVTATKKTEGPVIKTVTFDFVNENYGMTVNSAFKAEAKMCENEGVTLTNGSVTTTKLQAAGLYVANYPAYISVSSNVGPVTEVVITDTKNVEWKITYDNGVAKVQNYDDWNATNIKTMTVKYEDDGLEAAGIAFPAATLTLTNGVGELEGLVLENPNNLPVTYTSSNPDVIVNENGGISLAEGVKGATATITATFEGNDTYRKANASYALTVVASVNSINELKEYANANDIKAYVNFESVTVFRNGNFTYIQSLDGTQFTEIYQSTTYNPGDVIPMGWTATATKNSNGFMQYKMSNMPESTETKEPVVETVTAVTTEDATKVVILKDVEITDEVLAKMPNGTAGSAYNVTAGGTTYNVYNQFKVNKVEEAGNYDMKCSVMVYSNAVRLYPIEFTKATVAPEPVSGTATFDFVNEDYGLVRGGSDFIENGTKIASGDVNLAFTHSSGNGMRLWTDGSMRIYKGENTMSLSVDGAQITKVTMSSKQNLGTVTIDGTTVEFGSDKLYVWEGAAETVNVNIVSTATVNLYDVTVEYAALVPGKEPAGISFESAVYTTGDNQKYFTAATLNNPNKLPVIWTSSDETVASVAADGLVTILSTGKTTITAITAETDEFIAGKASYELNVVPGASTVPQMLAKAPAKGDQVLMNGDLYVTYVNGSYVYVFDGDDATLLYGANNYVTGDVIPGGWVATNAVYNNELQEWTGQFPAANGNMAQYLNYPDVQGVTEADINRVVTVPNVEFKENTPEKNGSVDIKLPDGSTIALYNKFDIASVAAGTYDVVAAVTIYNGALQLYPIEYDEVAAGGDPVFPESFVITHNGSDEDITITQGQGMFEYEIRVRGAVSSDNFVMNIAVPEGWTTFLFDATDVDISSDQSGDISLMRRAKAIDFYPVDGYLSYGYELGNVISYKADDVQTNVYGYIVKDDQFDMANALLVDIKVKKDETVGVEAIEAAEDGARYFTMDGVEVKNPAEGIYIKVVDGKAEKVVIK